MQDKNMYIKIKVIGIGNLLAGNDGIGIRVVQKLNLMKNKNKYLKNIEILDLGTCGLDILYYIENTNYVIFIDAIKSDKKIGSIFRVDGENIIRNDSSFYITSLHDINLKEILTIAKKLQKLPKIIFYGITVNSKTSKIINHDENNIIDLTLHIQEEIYNSIEKVISLVLLDIKNITKLKNE